MYSLMIVDDEKAIRENLSAIIDFESYEFKVCATAKNGQDALEKWEQFRPEVIFLDVCMPIMDGLAFLEALKKQESNMPCIVMLAVALVAGALVGTINGYLIAKQHMEPFIVTLSVQIALRGLNLFLTKGGYISKVNTFSWVGNGKLGIIPIPAIILVVMFIIFPVVMSKTVFGRNVYALGGNETAAKLSGIKTERVKIMSHVICGLLCAVAAVINVSRLATAEPLAAEGLEADAIAAALVGGNSLLGGRGSISGAFIGLLVFAILSNIFNLIGLKSAEQQIIKGVIIVIAVLVSQRRKVKSA